jgi:hypothetical protein
MSAWTLAFRACSSERVCPQGSWSFHGSFPEVLGGRDLDRILLLEGALPEGALAFGAGLCEDALSLGADLGVDSALNPGGGFGVAALSGGAGLVLADGSSHGGVVFGGGGAYVGASLSRGYWKSSLAHAHDHAVLLPHQLRPELVAPGRCWLPVEPVPALSPAEERPGYAFPVPPSRGPVVGLWAAPEEDALCEGAVRTGDCLRGGGFLGGGGGGSSSTTTYCDSFASSPPFGNQAGLSTPSGQAWCVNLFGS